MRESAVSRTPVEIWHQIILHAAIWHLIPSHTDFTLKHYAFSVSPVHPRCGIYHEFLAHEQQRLHLRLVCQSWNTVIMGIPPGGHYVLNDSTRYWPSRAHLSKAMCIEFEPSYSLASHCLCKPRSHGVYDWDWNLPPIPYLYSEEKDISESKGANLSADGPVEAIMLLLRCKTQSVHLEMIKNTRLLRALSWNPPTREDDAVSSLQNLLHLTHLELRLGPDHSKVIIPPQMTLPSLRVLLLSLDRWGQRVQQIEQVHSISTLSTPRLSIVRIRGVIDSMAEKDIQDYLIQYGGTITSLIVDGLDVQDVTTASTHSWEGTPEFWKSFPNLLFFAAELHQFFSPKSIPESLSYIASSNQPFLTITFRLLKTHKFCLKKGGIIAQYLTSWCSSHRSPSPIKHVALTESWSALKDRIKYDPRELVQIKEFIEGVYQGGMTFCDQNGVDFYWEGNEKLRNVLDVPSRKCDPDCAECLVDASSRDN